MNLQVFKSILKDFYSKEGAERVGFIVENSVIEVKNISPEPLKGFLVDPEDIIKHTDNGAWATWHTHPDQSSNLSGEDYRMFSNWSELTHFIIGSDGVKAFKYNENKKCILEV